ncbi:MAG: serine acetyltransferase [Acidobacteriia bacterium]|nr:serine acetyltransferase [Terriglobia bacterium]
MSNEDLQRLSREFRAALDARLAGEERSDLRLPDREEIAAVCRRYVEVLFALYFPCENSGRAPLNERAEAHLREMRELFNDQICQAMRFDCRVAGKPAPSNAAKCAEEQVGRLFEQFADLARLLGTDLEAAFQNDPAASNREVILLSYPCIEAITVQRLAHRLYQMEVPFIPRMLTEAAHSRTGIDMHPGAAIGESFFIDHGTGVVIGETATIGNHVTLYHGVTLGAFNPLLRDATGALPRGRENKRHPDIEDHVTVYPGATILGGETRIGHHSIIGGNVWLTHSVAPYSRVTMKDPELVIRSDHPKN